MGKGDTCERHAWASVGVVTLEDTVSRIWACEDCPAWTVEAFDPAYEEPWSETWLAER